MKFKNRILLIFGLFLAANLTAQDIHFTQFYMVPQGLNPALAGKFEGTVRLGGIYRDQWRKILGSGAYSTPQAFVDAPVIRGIRKIDWIGVGISVFQDKAGTLGLTHSGMRIGATYNLALNKKRTAVLSLGYHFGGEQRNLNEDAATFYDEIESNGAITSPDRGSLAAQGTTNQKNKDSGAGIALSARLNKNMDFNIGVGVFHLFEPKYSLVTSGFAKLPRRTVAHGQFNIAMNKLWTLTPQFIFQSMSGANEIAIQGIAGYEFDKKRQLFFDMGLGYRLADAVSAIVGTRYKNLKVGLAYDINTSSLRSETNRRGGFEIGAQYLIKIYKPPVRKQKIICPRF